MLAPGPYRTLRKSLRRLTKSEPEPCLQGRLLKMLIAEGEGPNVVPLRPSAMEDTRRALILAGKRHCIAKCGGCPLTDEMPPE